MKSTAQSGSVRVAASKMRRLVERPRAARHVAEQQPRETPDREARAEEEADEVRAEDVDEAADSPRLRQQAGEHRADDEEDQRRRGARGAR